MTKEELSHALNLIESGQDIVLVVYDNQGEEFILGDSSIPHQKENMIQFIKEELKTQ